MKRLLPILALAIALSLTGIALAGGGEECSDHHAKAAKTAEAGHHGHAEKVAQRAKHGWLGVETEKAETGYAIVKVYPGSPAAEAGFRSGDVLVAMNGITLKAENKKQLKAAKAEMWPGSEVEYTVVRDAGKQRLTATLAPVPQEILAQWHAEAEEEEATRLAANE